LVLVVDPLVGGGQRPAGAVSDRGGGVRADPEIRVWTALQN
jgi:hypothetical protein